ncbi:MULTISPECIES: glycosyltransferase family 2 protein [unclassified Modestobacter]|uniref:glycosyltransferase family 2 protein n=1 Tax=unclassified Modestobacter TaxID=2643866 RepID=UPI0022AA699D|nr:MULTISPECIES: glycosyltransferase [unclassified Modestobacter]MCZ2825596.1 glycosyltransferase [Modestobacter sp. VKM Ac-2981]MCZ2853339.1 glycosyltransferase [Modestobacter sp. VKM Ac-2982]
MLISVVLPVYNDEAHLADAIDRVLGQEGVDVELVVVDDGSTDRSRAIARAAADRDPRVRFVPLPENGGVARARERGVREATADWIWFVDSDDSWPSDAAAQLLAAALASPDTDVVVAGARATFESGKAPTSTEPPAGPPVPGRDAFSLFLTGQITGHLWNKLFRRELLGSIDFTPARVQSDLAMVAQAVAGARWVGFLPVTVYEYRVRSASIITSRSQRAESLELIATAVESAARQVGPGTTDTAEYRYFVTRYLTLSGIKDAVLGSYSPEQSAEHLRRLRGRLGVRELVLLARRRDAKRLALAVSAKVSLPAYRRLLAVADR